MPRSASAELERRILGLAMFHPEVAFQAASALRPEVFVVPEHRRVFEAIAALMQRDGRVSPFGVLRELDRRKVRLEGTLDPYLDDPGVAADAPALIEALREAHARRRVAEAAAELGKAAEEALDFDELAGLAHERALAVMQVFAEARPAVVPLREALSHIAAGITDPTLAGRRRLAFGLFQTLGRILRGLVATHLYVVAGRPGMGKTSLAVQIAMGAAEHGHARVLLFSLEMDAQDIAARITRQRTGINPADSPEWSAEQRQKAQAAIGPHIVVLSDWPVWICDRRDLRAADIAVIARRVAAEAGGLDLVVIDHLGLIHLTGDKGETTARKIGRVTQALRQLAADLNLPVVLLHQLNREVERRDNKRPTMADLRESGEIEAHADVILGLYRAGYYAKAGGTIAEILVLKNRDGKAGRNVGTLLRWNPPWVRFEEPSDEEIRTYREAQKGQKGGLEA